MEHVELSYVLAPPPPLAAYRADLVRLGRGVIGDDDAIYVTLATLLHRAAVMRAAGDDEARDALMGAARELIVRQLDIREGPPLDPPAGGPPSTFALVRSAIEALEDISGFELASSALASAVEVADSDIETGRLIAQRARVAWKAGAVNAATTMYGIVASTGRRGRLPELVVRASIGRAAVAQIRGNYPELERWAARGARLAEREGLDALASLAHQFLLVRSAKAGDFDGALVHGWRAFETTGVDPCRQAEMLLNLSQVLADAGHHEAAAHGLAAALARHPPARLALPSWGGLGTVAAELGNRALVVHATERVLELARQTSLPYPAAAALVEAAAARQKAGLDSDRWWSRASALASAFGFHEVTHQIAERTRTTAVPAVARTDMKVTARLLDRRGAQIAASIEALAPLEAAFALA